MKKKSKKEKKLEVNRLASAMFLLSASKGYHEEIAKENKKIINDPTN